MSDKKEAQTRTRTFGELKDQVLIGAGLPTGPLDHCQYLRLSQAHADFWDAMNHEEYVRGYVREEYGKPDSPALRDMTLLTGAEYQDWLARSPRLEWVIEFRDGFYFQGLDSDYGGPVATARKFASKSEAEAFMDRHQWLYLNGGMAVTLKPERR